MLSYYNGSKYINDQIDSLLNQDYRDYTIYIRDDGSTDGSFDCLDQYAGDGRFVLLKGENIGPARSFLDLIICSAPDADYYAFCDQDDVWAPDKLTRAATALSDFDGAVPVLYCSRLEYIDDDMRHLGFSRLPRKIGFGNALVENIVIGCTVVMNRAARDLIISRLPAICLMHDWWCNLVVSCFGTVLYDEVPTIRYRQHGANAVGAETGFVSIARKRLKRLFRRGFFKRGDGVFMVRILVSQFLECFADLLKPDQRILLERLMNAKRSVIERIALCFSRSLWRQSLVDDFMLRVLIVANLI